MPLALPLEERAMTAPNIRIAYNRNMFGDCTSLTVFRGPEWHQIGGAEWTLYPTERWLVGCYGFSSEILCDEGKSREEELAAVELLLKLQISAHDALQPQRAA